MQENEDFFHNVLVQNNFLKYVKIVKFSIFTE